MTVERFTSRSAHAAVPDRLAAPAALLGAGLLALACGWLLSHGRATLPVVAAAGALLVVPLIRDPRRGLVWAVVITLLVPASTTFASGKLSTIRVAAALALLAVALDVYNDPRIKRLSTVDGFVVAFAVVGIGGWLLEPQPPHGSAFAINYLLPFAFYVAARRFGRSAEVLLGVAFIGASLASLTVLYEALVAHRPLFADPTSYYWSATSAHIFRPGGVFGGPPQAASVLAMSTLCGLPLLYRARGLNRVGLGVCFVVSVSAMMLTFTRGPILGFVVGLLVFSALLGPASWARYAYVAGALAVVVAVLLLPRLETSTWFEKGVLRTGTLSARQVVWNQTAALITNSTTHELFGHGTNSIVIGTPWLPGAPPSDIAQVPALTEAGAQNQYIRTLIEGGATGLVLLVGWLLGAAAMGATASFRGVRNRREIAALTAACAAFAVTGLVDDVMRQTQTSVVIALVTGLLVSLSRQPGRSAAHNPGEPGR